MEMNLGLLIARLVFGFTMAAHGAQKLFGWFGGYGLSGTGQFLESAGLRPGRLMAALAGVSEVAGGLLIAFGLLGPIGPALILAVMITASSFHWKNGFFWTSQGVEVTVVYAAIATALALSGYGDYSIDALAGVTRLWTSDLNAAAVAVGVLGGIASLVKRRVSSHAIAA
jgi:putative oxidoreductase